MFFVEDISYQQTTSWQSPSSQSHFSLTYHFYHVQVIINHFLVWHLSQIFIYLFMYVLSLSPSFISCKLWSIGCSFPDHQWLLHKTSLQCRLSLQTALGGFPLSISMISLIDYESSFLQSWQYSNVHGYSPLALVNYSSIFCDCAYSTMFVLHTMALVVIFT